jgi:hypothetical protein
MGFWIDNIRTRPVYPVETRGTFAVEFETLWDNAELPRYTGARRYIYSLVVDANNSDEFYYDCDSESFVFKRVLAGVSKSVSYFYPQIKRGETIEVATRWVSAQGDLGEDPFAFTLFVQGEQGPTDAHTQKFPMPSLSKFWLGSNTGINGSMLDGYLRKLEIKQFALPQAAVRRLFS